MRADLKARKRRRESYGSSSKEMAILDSQITTTSSKCSGLGLSAKLFKSTTETLKRNWL